MKGTVLAHERTTFKVGRSALYAKHLALPLQSGRTGANRDGCVSHRLPIAPTSNWMHQTGHYPSVNCLSGRPGPRPIRGKFF